MSTNAAPRPRVIVLGARGFVGGAVRGELERVGRWEVIGLGSTDCDLTDRVAVRERIGPLAKDAHVVLSSSVLLLPGEPVSIFDANVAMARNLTEALAGQRPASFTFLSSSDVYGRPPSETPLREQSPLAVTGHYGLSKLVAERLLNFGIDAPLGVFRLPGVYGPGDGARSIVGQFATRLLDGQALTLAGGGTALRDYVHVQDVARLIAAQLMQPVTRTLNVATGRAISLAELAAVTAKACGVALRTQAVAANGPQYDLSFDVSALHAAFPGVSMTPIEAGVAGYVDALRKLRASPASKSV